MIKTSKTKDDEETNGLDLTPLLDIIFIVIVFLLLSVGLKLKALKVDLPKENSAALSKVSINPVIISIRENQPYWVLKDNPETDWSTFSAELQDIIKRKPDTKVAIATDRKATAENLLKLMVFLRQENISVTKLLLKHGYDK